MQWLVDVHIQNGSPKPSPPSSGCRSTTSGPQVSEGIEDGVDIGEIAKHRVRDGEDIEADFREQALTHKV